MSEKPRIAALIVAAGIGKRAGGEIPKQYQPIGGKPLLAYSLAALASHPDVDAVQVVIHVEHAGLYEEAAAPAPKLLPPIIGGAERSDSVRAGLAALAAENPDYVLIHDAARPFLSHAVIDALIAGLTPTQAVIPALSAADTMRRFDGKSWEEVPREGLLRIQTPQAFPYQKLCEMMSVGAPIPNPESRIPLPTATDEAALWLAAGGKLVYVEGHEDLRKVTTASDIAWAQKQVSSATRTAIGSGYDVHALVPSPAGTIRLGGIDIAHSHQLDGHSDADVVLHAIVDALLGTIAAGDIGSFFPPSDARWKGANSAIFIEEARAQVASRGGIIEHLDITIIGEQPKISPQREAMRASIAKLLHLPVSYISVKATTTEKLGFTGREEGIACQAVATVRLPKENA